MKTTDPNLRIRDKVRNIDRFGREIDSSTPDNDIRLTDSVFVNACS